jgi:hypothetical protein
VKAAFCSAKNTYLSRPSTFSDIPTKGSHIG